jgi:hypothetical protein
VVSADVGGDGVAAAQLLPAAAGAGIRPTEAMLLKALRGMHGGDAWGLLTKVRSGTGFSDRLRTADALAMSLWPSRGLELHGFEVKVSRSDWVKELRVAAKAEEFARYCDRWWVVAGVVREGELPPTWGLLVWHAGQLTVGFPAPKLSPEPMTRTFVASLFRSLSRAMNGAAASPAELAAAREEGAEAAVAAAAEQERRWHFEAEDLKRVIGEFEEASGVKINRWEGKRIGGAVRAVMAGESGQIIRKLQSLRDDTAAALRELDKAIAEGAAS